MSVRYAVYLAPPPDSALWRFGSRALGRDAATGEELHGFTLPGFTPQTWRTLTSEPRRYGFHATLKAPFRLKEGRTREDLEDAIQRLAGSTPAFDLGPLRVAALSFAGGAFIALAPVRAPPALRELEARTLRDLDEFRAPPTELEMKRRKPERLTSRQRGYLETWGYPYVLEEFRLHFTLTKGVEAPDPIAEPLGEAFAQSCDSANLRVDALALFVQQPGAEFRIARRFALA